MSNHVEGGRRLIDRILSPAYVEGLAALSMPDLRARRAECEEEEALLSYERRLLHARLDILSAEQARRAGGGGGPSLVSRLAEILADEPRQSRGAFSRDVATPSFDQPRRRVEKLVSDDTLATLAEIPDDRVAAIAASLVSTEAEVSEQRRAVQGVLDALTQEVMRRYKSGEADPSDVLTGR